MIKGMHGLFFASDAEKARAFFRDVLGFPSNDAGDGWLIFQAPEADFGVHPAPPGDVHHEVSFYCDDIHATVAELEGKGVKFLREVSDQGWGYETRFELPGGGSVQLYQPKYDKP
ncbi:MAG: VOC family protein [Dehalococcoidia bacterium]